MEFIRGDQGSGRSARLAAEIAAARGPVLLVDPSGSWAASSGGRAPAGDVFVMGREALRSAPCATVAIAASAVRLGVRLVAIDDGESLVAGRTQWASLGVALRAAGARLVVVVPDDSQRVEVAARQSRRRSRLLDQPRPAA